LFQASISGDKDTSQGTVDSTVGIDKAWKWGLFSAVRFSTSLLRVFTSNPTEAASSALTASLSQPLLQGFGSSIAAENLTQSERNVIYAVRAFERYRREFAVNITRSYLRALQRYDSVANAKSNLSSTRSNYELVKAQAEAGRIPFFQLDQTATSVLSAEDGLNRAENDLKDALDGFKIALGLPLEQEIELDASELTKLKAEGFENLGIGSEEAAEIALSCRLDLANQREQVEDAERTVLIAADNLRTKLDLVGDVRIPTEQNKPFKLQTEKFTYTVGFDLDLPLERTQERNTYRSALISLDRTRRDLEETEDRTRLEVAVAFRSLERELRSFEIQRESRNVANLRVQSTQELLKYGRVAARELLESLDDELGAKNALTAALIDYHIAYLEFLLALGVMEVDEDGVYAELAWEEEDADTNNQS
jgi:outer membrane protein TolC